MTTRRDFIEASSVAGALLIGFRLPLRSTPFVPAIPSVPSELNAWIRIAADNTVSFFVNESEMGQGVMTSLPMILAEELDADWSKITAEHAPVEDRFGRMGTGGSTSIRTNFDRLRKVGAAARHMLVQAAAQEWGVDPAECTTRDSTVLHAASRRALTYGELAEQAALITPPEDPPVKDRSEYKIVGKPTKRLDTPAKVRGEAVFGIDVKVPGMLIAQVAHCPVFGGKLRSFDGARSLAVEGVRHVVEIPSGVAVVAEHYWAAKKGLDALDVSWDDGGYGALSSEGMTARCRDIVKSGVDARKDGDVAGALARAASTLSAVYQVPYLAHATMEPMNCTADVRADRCEVWAPTQAPTGSRQLAARITGLPLEKVTLHTTYMGGGFGRRSETDFVKDAVHTSKAVGVPVKVVWSREEDMCGGWYRPMAYNEFEAALDADGCPIAWVHRIASPSILEGKGFLRGEVDSAAVEGAANIPYGIPNVHVTWANPKFPVTTHWWRSVGSSQNAYVTECFFDEVAKAGGKDPFEARRRLLADKPRHKRVLEVAAEHAGWGSPLPAGRAHGIAVHESFGSFVAQVAEVSLRDDGSVRVHRVTCVVDCGDVINPDTIEAQMESGITYGLSAALYNEITIERGRAVQRNFDTYPVVRMREMPKIDVHIVTSGDPLGGIGEPGTPPIAPAVCNALFALTGKPVRRLPIQLG